MVHCSNSVFQLFFWLRTFFLFLQKNLLIRFSFPVFAPLNLYNEVLIFCQSITFLLKLFFSTQKCQKTVTECILWLNPGKKIFAWRWRTLECEKQLVKWPYSLVLPRERVCDSTRTLFTRYRHRLRGVPPRPNTLQVSCFTRYYTIRCFPCSGKRISNGFNMKLAWIYPYWMLVTKKMNNT